MRAGDHERHFIHSGDETKVHVRNGKYPQATIRTGRIGIDLGFDRYRDSYHRETKREENILVSVHAEYQVDGLTYRSEEAKPEAGRSFFYEEIFRKQMTMDYRHTTAIDSMYIQIANWIDRGFLQGDGKRDALWQFFIWFMRSEHDLYEAIEKYYPKWHLLLRDHVPVPPMKREDAILFHVTVPVLVRIADKTKALDELLRNAPSVRASGWGSDKDHYEVFSLDQVVHVTTIDEDGGIVPHETNADEDGEEDAA